jgi:23S rRNA (cytosine1962-C5)-methyltransferase
MGRVVLRKGKVKPVWLGHPWVFRGAIAEVRGEPETGEIVVVEDAMGKTMGRGFWHRDSVIAVRVLPSDGGERIDAAWVRGRVDRALRLRGEILQLPNDQTNAYRLINSEGDGFPGVVADVFGDTVAVGFTSYGAWRLREDVYDAIESALSPRAVVEVDIGAHKAEGIPIGPRVVRGDLGKDGAVAYRQSGLDLSLRLPGGQKTGAYLDQRENRERIASLAKGRRVLDLHCHHGGFALTAAAAGASQAVGVDSSSPAIEVAKANATNNGLAEAVSFVMGDVHRFLKGAAEANERFDIVLVDPPPMARSRAHVEQALRAHRALHGAALEVLSKDGLLLVASCTSAIGHDPLGRALVEAARERGRAVQVIEWRGASADHPVRLPCVEGRYLSALLCRVE